MFKDLPEAQLDRIVEELGDFKDPRRQHLIGSVNRGPCTSLVILLRARLNLEIIFSLLLMSFARAQIQLFLLLSPPDNPRIFSTHGDIPQGNIMVSDHSCITGTKLGISGVVSPVLGICGSAFYTRQALCYTSTFHLIMVHNIAYSAHMK